MQYGQQIAWRGWGGARTVVEVRNGISAADALSKALRVAISCGWTPPKWWQWWRWGDLDYSRVKPWHT